MDWQNRPTSCDYWESNIDYTLFIDENGDSNLKHIIKMRKASREVDLDNRFFTVTGCAINKKDFSYIKKSIAELKLKYWNEGKFLYKDKDGEKLKRVCFHSKEIRDEKGPFCNSVIDCKSFKRNLTDFIKNIPITLFSSSIDKYKHYLLHEDNPISPYSLSLVFILERFARFFLNANETGIIILESRGKKEDREILQYILNVICKGTYYVSQSYFNRIKGVYFNPKWCVNANEQSSYFGLEIADICSYPIHKYVKYGTKDSVFEIVEEKLYNYPFHNGYGLKIFP